MSSTERNSYRALRPRSYLYAPGDRPDLLAKALAGEADVVVADLEDAVAPERRETARGNVLAALADAPAKPLHVRVGLGDELFEDDLRALARSGVPLVRIAKSRDAAEVRRAGELLDAAGAPAELALSPLIESAHGVEHAFEIATAHPRVAAISLGEADLRADLGVADERGLLYARSRIVVAARAAGLPAPSQSVYTDVRDLDGLRRSCLDGRALGFHGRSVVHPKQIAVVHEAYQPSDAERASAAELVAAAGRLAAEGAFLLDDGRLVDNATVEQARALLEATR